MVLEGVAVLPRSLTDVVNAEAPGVVVTAPPAQVTVMLVAETTAVPGGVSGGVPGVNAGEVAGATTQSTGKGNAPLPEIINPWLAISPPWVDRTNDDLAGPP